LAKIAENSEHNIDPCSETFLWTLNAQLKRWHIRVDRFFLVHDTKTGKMYQVNTNCTKWSLNIPNVHKIFQMAVKYINIFQSEDLDFFPNWDFWFENKPSGNPVAHLFSCSLFKNIVVHDE
jgi:hypothetical protein